MAGKEDNGRERREWKERKRMQGRERMAGKEGKNQLLFLRNNPSWQ